MDVEVEPSALLLGLPEITLYPTTRHYFGWCALDVLELAPHLIAEQLGHCDEGGLVVELDGHPDKARACRCIPGAYDNAAKVRPLRVVTGNAHNPAT